MNILTLNLLNRDPQQDKTRGGDFAKQSGSKQQVKNKGEAPPGRL